jgi:choline kinase
MGALTADQPKCLIELAGKRLLEWQMAALNSAGLHAITVIRGYRKELLSSPAYAALDSPNWTASNMVATLSCAAHLLRRFSCVVSYSDIVYHPDHVRELVEAQGDVAICFDVLWESLWAARFENPLTDAETFRHENGWLRAIGNKTDDILDIQGQYLGLLKFTPTGWAASEEFLSELPAEERSRIDMTGMLRGLLNIGVKVRCVPVSGRWCEVDSESDVRLYERLLSEKQLNNRKWDHDWCW